MNNKIMVVDDEDCIRDLFVRMFKKAGYQVQTAASAEQALELMYASPSEVLFLDLNLPVMNGLDLCRQVRVEWPWCICIAVTGYAALFELIACREVGFEDYFIKPVPSEELLAAAGDAFKKLKRWRRRQTALVNNAVHPAQAATFPESF